MQICIEVSDELMCRLTAEANVRGLPVPDYLRQKLARTEAAETPRTGAELVAYWQAEGLVGTRPEIIDSQTLARELRARAERRPGG